MFEHYFAGLLIGVIAGALLTGLVWVCHHHKTAGRRFLLNHCFDELMNMGYSVDPRDESWLRPPQQGLPLFGRWQEEAIAGLKTLVGNGWTYEGGELWKQPLGAVKTSLIALEFRALAHAQETALRELVDLKEFKTLHQLPDGKGFDTEENAAHYHQRKDVAWSMARLALQGGILTAENQAPAEAHGDERAAFERELKIAWPFDNRLASDPTKYVSPWVQAQWESWQARAALAPNVQPKGMALRKPESAPTVNAVWVSGNELRVLLTDASQAKDVEDYLLAGGAGIVSGVIATQAPAPAPLDEVRGIVAKMRADLTASGGFDNSMLGVPAGGVRAQIERLEAALAAASSPAVAPEVAELVAAAEHARDVLAELYAKYQTKIGPFASQAQLANVKLGAALKAILQPPVQNKGAV